METKQTHTLIIGSGIAGLLLALELAGKNIKVTLACKESLADSNSTKAQGGIAAVCAGAIDDSPLLHFEDTLKAGAGLTDSSIAWQVVSQADQVVERLLHYSVQFDRTHDGANLSKCGADSTNNFNFDKAKEGGHSRARVLHNKDATGLAITSGLISSLRSFVNKGLIDVIEHAFALDLLKNETGCLGASFIVKKRKLRIFAHNTVLCTGGLGQVFSRTSNPAVATGDGIAMAYRAGATVADMEFVQFHPTALYLKGAPALLISEAVRGAGAHLVDKAGERFAFRFNQSGELATRDIVTKAIKTIMEEQETENVFLDFRPIGNTKIESHFPNILKTCLKAGIDPRTTPVPIAPAAHYFMGGIKADLAGRTNINRLYALGECAFTGLHGANRLASNSLLEGAVMALNLASQIEGAERLLTPASRQTAGDRKYSTVNKELVWPRIIPADLAIFRKLMYRYAGPTRSETGLETLLDFLHSACLVTDVISPAIAQASNMLLLGELIAESALWRQESRGSHQRSDYGTTNDASFKKHLFVNLQRRTAQEAPPLIA